MAVPFELSPEPTGMKILSDQTDEADGNVLRASHDPSAIQAFQETGACLFIQPEFEQQRPLDAGIIVI